MLHGSRTMQKHHDPPNDGETIEVSVTVHVTAEQRRAIAHDLKARAGARAVAKRPDSHEAPEQICRAWLRVQIQRALRIAVSERETDIAITKIMEEKNGHE